MRFNEEIKVAKWTTAKQKISKKKKIFYEI